MPTLPTSPLEGPSVYHGPVVGPPPDIRDAIRGLHAEYGPALRASPELLRLAEDASRELAEIVWERGRPFLAEWERVEGPRMAPVVLLRLQDRAEIEPGVMSPSVSAVFEPGELVPDLPRRSRLLSIWIDLLDRQGDVISAISHRLRSEYDALALGGE